MTTASSQHALRRRQPLATWSTLTVLIASAALWLGRSGSLANIGVGRLLGLLAVGLLLGVYLAEKRHSPPHRGRGNDDVPSPLDRRLLEASRQVNQSLDLERVLDTVLSQARELLDARDGSLMLVHGTRELRVSAVIGDSAANGARRAFGEGIAGRVASCAKPQLIAGTIEFAGRRVPPEAPAAPASALSVPLLDKNHLIGVLNLNAAHGQSYCEADLRVLELFSGQAGNAIANAQRFEAERLLSSRSRYLALHDPLTHLPNRAHFLARLERALADQQPHSPAAVLYLDLNDFKPINDRFGHDVGDALLCGVADRLRQALRSTDLVARLGGDEFAVLLPPASSAPTVLATAHRLLQALAEPVRAGAHSLVVQASIGAAIAEHDGNLGDDLLRRADSAMQLAKARSNNQPVLAEPSQHPAQSPPGIQLRRALASDQLELRYRPWVDLESDTPLGFEALAFLRTHQPTLSRVEPGALKDPQLAIVFDNWILEHALHPLASATDQRLDLYLSLQAPSLSDPALPSRLTEACRRAGLALDRLVLQIPERIVQNDLEHAAHRLTRLKALGLRIALDQFGSGEAPEEPLHRLPVDMLRVDPMFVSGLAQDSGAETLLGHLLGLQQALDLEIVVSGVDRLDQADRLRQLGAHLATGSYFGEPLSVAQLAASFAARPFSSQAS